MDNKPADKAKSPKTKFTGQEKNPTNFTGQETKKKEVTKFTGQEKSPVTIFTGQEKKEESSKDELKRKLRARDRNQNDQGLDN